MKKINKYIAIVGLGAVALSSCESLDTEYLGYFVSEEQKGQTLEKNPSMAQAAVTGCFASFSQYMSVYGSHFDFGYPAIMVGLDLQGTDMIAPNSGYNWFSYWEGFTSPTPGGTPSGMAWYHIYDQIYSANAVAGTISPDTEDLQLKFYRAQAVGTRAFDYWVLAQLYQYNYTTSQSKPCVPILTDENSATVAAEGAPRATVQEVYDQILKDINECIALLSATTITPEQVIDSKPKRMISLAVAYGLRARIHLTMHKYAEAAADAQSAITNFNGRPYSIEEVSKPTFTSLDDPAWMWGIAIAETDRVVTSGIINYPSHVVTFCGNGYVSVGAWKWIAGDAYAAIPATDVRKGWFLDENLESPNLSAQQQNYINGFDDIPPYTQVKIDAYQGVVGQSTNANDIPLMRIEEMYYILAEAQAMSGNPAQGLDTFTKFIQQYRNPSFSASASSAAEVQELIYQDRRVEFYAEGLSWFDIMRLGKRVDRTKAGNYPPAFVFNIAPDDPCLIYCIPTGEINGNPQISDSDNNPSGTRPKPVV